MLLALMEIDIRRAGTLTKCIDNESQFLPIQALFFQPLNRDHVKNKQDDEVGIFEKRSNFWYFEPGNGNHKRLGQRTFACVILMLTYSDRVKGLYGDCIVGSAFFYNSVNESAIDIHMKTDIGYERVCIKSRVDNPPGPNTL